ncbi:MAG TPA: serine/threonine-protein kinase [Thermoanaerobaculia bacterium]
MHLCPSCGADLVAGHRFCASCGASVDGAGDGLTQGGAGFSTPQAPDPLPPAPGREPAPAMLPGTMVAGRYRVVALVGRGGMGEVYRADDLKLGQTVALKFLPRSVGHDGPPLSRFLDEVRIARQISHPNICRVYDVGDAEGRHFLSMEFIDGEDLASLLRRIGRVPPEKAVQIARQLCAGLAAAHDQRVLHRDLKPANVMIDGRGRARITDFGLAVLQEGVPREEMGAGTPAYMAPEQLEGREVTVRSDLYSLGLVLYELFAGRPAFERGGSLRELRERRSSPPTAPSSHVDGLDPAVERVILRCLELDPALRPSSALGVAAALPGGDPLAAALAAGETPAPEVVAAAAKVGSWRPGRAAGTLVATLLLWSAAFVLTTLPLRHLSFERSPEALADRARDLLARLGHAEKPVDRAWGYSKDDRLLLRLRHQPPAGLVAAALQGQSPVVQFWYREGGDYLVPQGGSRVRPDDPPFEAPGARRLTMTTDGRLLSLRVIPGAQPARPVTRETDWSALLEAAGLNEAELEPTAPTVTPPDFADTRAAWLARATEPAGLRLRVEAAALGGVPVSFRAAPDLPAGVAAPPAAATTRERFFYLLLLTLLTSILAAALWLARRNLQAGRADRRGAMLVAAVVTAVQVLAWTVSASHAPVLAEFGLLFQDAAWVLLQTGVVWILYLALEPLLRRRSPASLVSWTRLLAGRPTDPLVGRDLLLGSLFGAATLSVGALLVVSRWRTGQDPVPAPENVAHLIGVPGLFRVFTRATVVSFVNGMGFLVLWQLFSWVLRSSTRGAIALGAVLLFGLSVAGGVGTTTLFLLAEVALIVVAIARLGLLATVTMIWLRHLAIFFPLWSGPSAWFFGESLVVFVLGALPAIWGAWAVTRGGVSHVRSGADALA